VPRPGGLRPRHWLSIPLGPFLPAVRHEGRGDGGAIPFLPKGSLN